MKRMGQANDVIVWQAGSGLMMFRPLTPEAKAWVDAHADTPMWFADSFAVEHRYALDLALGMRDAGLTVR